MKKNINILIISIPLSILAFIVMWAGFEGLLVNLSGELKVFTIREVEESGLGTARFVEINGGKAVGQSLPMLDEYGKVQKVFYPIGSDETLNRIYKGDKIIFNVLIEDSNGNPDIMGEINIKGITTRDIDSETKKSIQKLNNELFEISDNIVIVQDGTQPRAFFWNIIMIVSSIVSIFYLLFAISNSIKNTSASSEVVKLSEDNESN